jgi:hypothetical protein
MQVTIQEKITMKNKPSKPVAATRAHYLQEAGKVGNLLYDLTPDLGPKHFLSKGEMIALRYSHKTLTAQQPMVSEVTLIGKPLRPNELLAATPANLIDKIDEALDSVDLAQVDLRITAVGVVLPHLIGAGKYKGRFALCLHALVATRSMDPDNWRETLEYELPKNAGGGCYYFPAQTKKGAASKTYWETFADSYRLPDGPLEMAKYGRGPVIGRALRRGEWDNGVLKAWRRKYRTERLFAYEASY